ncbi:MAG: hypothetical protein GY845_02230 [Planctomycetes bacterium]|nr:hypothetical protein [Planctomycetota bacterium]
MVFWGKWKERPKCGRSPQKDTVHVSTFSITSKVTPVNGKLVTVNPCLLDCLAGVMYYEHMTYDLSYKNELDYLHVRVTGVRTQETLMTMAAEVLSLCAEYKCSRTLIDIQEMIGALDPLDSYDYGSDYLPKLVPTDEFKIAVIDLEENRNRFQLVRHNARINGLDIHIVSDVNIAKRWLGVGKGIVSE